MSQPDGDVFNALLRVLDLAEEVALHHDAEQLLEVDPGSIEAQLLLACREARCQLAGLNRLLP